MDLRSVSCDNVTSNLQCVQSRYRLYCGIGCDSGEAVRVEAEDATVIYIYMPGRRRAAASGLCNISPTRYIHQIVQRPPRSRGEKLGEEAV